MAFNLTYNSLYNTVLAYLERDASDENLTADIPVFIMLAQARISKDFKSLGLELYENGTLVNGNGALEKPANWRNTISFNIETGDSFNESKPLKLRSYEFCKAYWPDLTKTGEPKYYCDYGFQGWLIVPTPDENYPIEISYAITLQPIDETNQTNWATENTPELLIYGSLLESMLYIKNDERIQFYQAEYERALGSLRAENEARLTDRYSQRNKI